MVFQKSGQINPYTELGWMTILMVLLPGGTILLVAYAIGMIVLAEVARVCHWILTGGWR